MWFGDLDESKASSMLTQLSTADHQTDWGMRILSNKAEKFSGGGYHYGSVWPLFTGWASVAEYRYHHEHAAYANLRSNALLALDGSPGHVTEVLSGDYYQGLSTSSPHQIWSAAMVVSPMLRGLFGLSTDAQTNTVTLAPHLPADWQRFTVRQCPRRLRQLNIPVRKHFGRIDLQIQNHWRCGGKHREFRASLQPSSASPLRIRQRAKSSNSKSSLTMQTNMSSFSSMLALAQAKSSIHSDKKF